MRINRRGRRERQVSKGQRMRGGCALRSELNVRVQALAISQIKLNSRNSKTIPQSKFARSRTA